MNVILQLNKTDSGRRSRRLGRQEPWNARFNLSVSALDRFIATLLCVDSIRAVGIAFADLASIDLSDAAV